MRREKTPVFTRITDPDDPGLLEFMSEWLSDEDVESLSQPFPTSTPGEDTPEQVSDNVESPIEQGKSAGRRKGDRRGKTLICYPLIEAFPDPDDAEVISERIDREIELFRFQGKADEALSRALAKVGVDKIGILIDTGRTPYHLQRRAQRALARAFTAELSQILGRPVTEESCRRYLREKIRSMRKGGAA